MNPFLVNVSIPDKINQNELMSKKHKKVCMVLNYTKYIHISVSVVTGCVSISTFAYLIGVPITAGIKRYKSIIKKKKKNLIKQYSWQKLNIIEVLVSKALIDSFISLKELVLVNNVLKEHDNMKEKRTN